VAEPLIRAGAPGGGEERGADLERVVKTPGQAAPLRTYLFRYSSHSYEHLGQLIAYARINGVAPPW